MLIPNTISDSGWDNIGQNDQYAVTYCLVLCIPHMFIPVPTSMPSAPPTGDRKYSDIRAASPSTVTEV